MRRSSIISSRLIVDVLAIADGANLDYAQIIIDRINDAMITDADPPETASASQLLASWWPRRTGETLDARKDSLKEGIRKALELLARRTDELN